MKLTKYEQLKDGMKVRFKLESEGKVFEGKLRRLILYNIDTKFFNVEWIAESGFKRTSWLCSKPQDITSWSSNITDLESIEEINEEILEVTKEEIAKKFGVDVDRLVIKE